MTAVANRGQPPKPLGRWDRSERPPWEAVVRRAHGWTGEDHRDETCRYGCGAVHLEALMARTGRCPEMTTEAREWLGSAMACRAAEDFADADPLSPAREVALRIAALRGEVRRLSVQWNNYAMDADVRSAPPLRYDAAALLQEHQDTLVRAVLNNPEDPFYPDVLRRIDVPDCPSAGQTFQEWMDNITRTVGRGLERSLLQGLAPDPAAGTVFDRTDQTDGHRTNRSARGHGGVLSPDTLALLLDLPPELLRPSGTQDRGPDGPAQLADRFVLAVPDPPDDTAYPDMLHDYMQQLRSQVERAVDGRPVRNLRLSVPDTDWSDDGLRITAEFEVLSAGQDRTDTRPTDTPDS